LGGGGGGAVGGGGGGGGGPGAADVTALVFVYVADDKPGEDDDGEILVTGDVDCGTAGGPPGGPCELAAAMPQFNSVQQ